MPTDSALAVLRATRTASSPATRRGRGESLPDRRVDEALDARCRGLVRALARRRLARSTRVGEPLDVRTLCLARETLAYHDALADFAFAMQGLGAGAISLFGRDDQRQRYLPAVAAGEQIAAFALSEPEAGSDVARDDGTTRGDGGTSSTGDEDVDLQRRDRRLLHRLRARSAARASARSSSTPTRRSEVAERIDVIAPHPLARARASTTRPAAAARRRRARGCKIALAHARRLPLDGRRGGARLRPPRARRGARARAARASCSARRWPSSRSCRPSSPTWRSAIDASALLVYRAAWTKDVARRPRHARGGDGQAARDRDRAARRSTTPSSSSAALGVTAGHPRRAAVPRDPRAADLRGGVEVQQLIIARASCCA